MSEARLVYLLNFDTVFGSMTSQFSIHPMASCKQFSLLCVLSIGLFSWIRSYFLE